MSQKVPQKVSDPPVAKRTYNSSRRALQAAQTRSDVIEAAIQLFSLNGWSATTLAAIAEQAGVAVETVYQGFKSKKHLVRAAMETAIVGDSEPIPFVERPEFLALGEGTIDERLARGVNVIAEIHARAAGVWQAVVEASGSDEEIAEWRIEMEHGRRIDIGRSLELIVGEAIAEPLLTVLWLLYSSESYLKLTYEAGMSPEQYQALMVDTTKRLLASR